MNITSKCRCGAEFSIDYKSDTSISSSGVFHYWQKIHENCKDKYLTSHIAFKYLLNKASEK